MMGQNRGGREVGTPCGAHQSFAGLTFRDEQLFTPADNLESPIYLIYISLDEERKPEYLQTPTQTWDNM